MPVVEGRWPARVDEGRGGGDDGGMEARLRYVEDALIRIEATLPHLGTRAELADVKTAVVAGKNAIIQWVVGAIIVVQLLPALPGLLRAFGLIR